MIDRPALSEVLDRLGGDVDRDAARTAIRAREGQDAPWFVQVLVTAAAWVAAILSAGFLALFDVVTESNAALYVLPTAIAAIGLRWLARRGKAGRVAMDLVEQVALALSGLARWFAFVGMPEQTRSGGLLAGRDDMVAILLALLALEILFLILYPDRLQRFVATLLAGLWLTLLDGELGFGPYARQAYVTAAAAAAAALWLRPPPAPLAAWRAPVGFGLVLFAGVSLFEGALFEAGNDRLARLEWPTTLGMAAVALWIAFDVARERGVPPTSTLALAGFGALAVLAAVGWREPGFVAAAGLLVLAVHRRERILFGLGVVFLVAFGIHYYYSLELDLMAKAGVLVGSGLVFLAARWGILRAFDARQQARPGPVTPPQPPQAPAAPPPEPMGGEG